jgi:hypothetical protein
MSDPVKNKWERQDDLPIPEGITHAAVAEDSAKSTAYICGGYMGASKGIATTDCWMFSLLNPKGKQWTSLPSLPAERGGGAMWYNKALNSLIFTAGASRPHDVQNRAKSTDHDDTWKLSLTNLAAGWIAQARIPYKGNHVGHVTVVQNGIERHWIGESCWTYNGYV